MQKIIRDDIANLDYVNCPNKIKIYTDKGNYNLGEAVNTVSYTHLTLPTILRV